MGFLICKCGHKISDVVCPCPYSGELRWDPARDGNQDRSISDVTDFLTAVEEGRKEDWLRNYFSESFYQTQLTMSNALIIDDIYSHNSDKNGQAVYRCNECERLYVQKAFAINEYDCFEKTDW